MMAFKFSVPPVEGQRFTAETAEAMVGQSMQVKIAGHEVGTGRVRQAELALDGSISVTVVASVPEDLREFLTADDEGLSLADAA